MTWVLLLFFVFPINTPGLPAFLAPSLKSRRREENPEDAAPFLPGSRGPRPSAFPPPVLRVSQAHRQSLGLRLVGRRGKVCPGRLPKAQPLFSLCRVFLLPDRQPLERSERTPGSSVSPVRPVRGTVLSADA